ncbi:MAG: sulfur carrier protein ThiS [Chthoniobacterales bacterium]|nr:sulfur carrier protein ThiS [Chthoniobacterales bacterium]
MKTFSIQLNGESYSTAACSIVELLQELSLPLSTVLVEQNGLALLRQELEKAPLREGDRLELLKVVAGG